MNGPGFSSHSFHKGDQNDPGNGASSGEDASITQTSQAATPGAPQDSTSSVLVPPASPSGAVLDTTGTDQTAVQRPSLGEAILKVYKSPQFLGTLGKLVSQGGPSRIRNVWDACEQILDVGPTNRAAIVSDIMGAVVRYYKSSQNQTVVPPPKRVIAELMKHYSGSPSTILQYCRVLHSKPLEVVATPEVLRACTGEILCNVVRANYPTAIADPNQHGCLEKIIRHSALKRDGSSLEMCAFIRDKYEVCRGWIGKEIEADFLWTVRDRLTSVLVNSPLASEANLKLSLMYLREIPHPALDRAPQSLLNTERWILNYPMYLEAAFGVDYAMRVLSANPAEPLSSSAFMYLGSAPEATIRGVQDSLSKFDMDANTLQPLYRALGIRCDGASSAAVGSPVARERPPRTWISKDDEMRFQQSQIVAAFRCLAERYWAPELPDRMRQRALEFVRAVIHEQPYALALAAPSLRRLGGGFNADLSRIVREESILTCRRFADFTGENSEIRQRVVVADGFGLSIPELQTSALGQFEVALQSTSRSMMQDFEHVAFLGAMRLFCATTPTVEAHARQLIDRYPNTLGAGLLARYLFEVRASDRSLREVVYRQSATSNLDPKVWIQYAHAAVGFGVDAVCAENVRTVFESHYERPMQVYARWSPRLRASYRMVLGSLYPQRVGQVTPLQRHHNRLAHSSLEARVVRALEQIPGIRVPQDVFIPWAPAIDGVVVSNGNPHQPVPLLIDGEFYHSVNKSWSFRGFDGHSLLAKNILCRAGHPVIRISAQLGEPGMEKALQDCIVSIVNYLDGKGQLDAERLIVDAPDEYSDIAGKVMFYHAVRPAPDTYAPVFDAWKALQQSPDMHSDDGVELQKGESSL